jgi:Tol biopolymer transport system component
MRYAAHPQSTRLTSAAPRVVLLPSIPSISERTTTSNLRETPPPETRTEINTPATDSLASFALSPDGRQIVFAASGDGGSRLWLRSLATTTAQLLAGTEGATCPVEAQQRRQYDVAPDGVS